MIKAIFNKTAFRGEQIVAIVLGNRITKAVHLRREEEQLILVNYLLLDAPDYKSGSTREALTGHFRKIRDELGAKINQVVLVIGMGESVIRHIELPALKPAEMRQTVKLNSKHYFQQELSDNEFDCFVLPMEKPGEGAGTSKTNCVLVGGAKREWINDIEGAAKAVHWHPVQITLSQVALFNAATLAMPEVALEEAVALVDLGFGTSTISLLRKGKLDLNRVIGLGSDQMTKGLAEILGVTYPIAENIKMVMPEKVQAKLQDLLSPLSQELRTAIHFFEAQHNQRISHVLVSGGSARSQLIIQALQNHLEIPCKSWDPAHFLNVRLSSEKAASLAKDGPQLADALGAAAGGFMPELMRINLLAGKIEAERQRQKDPVRWGVRAAALMVVFMLLWAGWLRLELWLDDAEMARYTAELGILQRKALQATDNSKKVRQLDRSLHDLDLYAANRFLWALPLNALQFAMVPDIQIIQVKIKQTVIEDPGVKPQALGKGKVTPGRPPTTREAITLVIQAKDSGHPQASEKFIETLASQLYFKDHLRAEKPVRLVERLPSQVDPLDPTKDYVLFTIECYFPEKEL